MLILRKLVIQLPKIPTTNHVLLFPLTFQGLSCIWEKERGFGERSWRYSAVINNGVVEKINVEAGFAQDHGPDPFEVSDAATMVNYLESVADANTADAA